MTVSRQTAQTVTTLRTLIARETGDLASDGTAQHVRWPTGEVDQALNYQLLEMGNDMAGAHPGDALLNQNLSYSGSTPVDLPSSVVAETIYRVDDITAANIPVQLQYVSPLELDDYNPGETFGGAYRYKYTLLGASTNATTYRIQVFPIPTGTLTLRIWYVAPPYVPGAAADSVPLSPKWLEFVALGSALRLLSRDDEATLQQLGRYERLRKQWQESNRRQRGPQRIRKARRGVS